MLLPEDFIPGPTDILCGRGNLCTYHEGNLYFGRIIQASLEEYVAARNRPNKIKVVDKILVKIKNSGARFAKLDKKSGQWYQLNDVQAHQKIGHAIRDTIRLVEKDKKRKSKQWFQLNDFQAHQKVGHTILDTNMVLNKNKIQETAEDNPFLKKSVLSARCITGLKKKRKFPLHPTLSSSIAMEDIMRLSLETVSLLDDVLGDTKVGETHTSISAPRPITNDDCANTQIENDTCENDFAYLHTPAVIAQPSFLLEDEYPDTKFDFSKESFFGDLPVVVRDACLENERT